MNQLSILPEVKRTPAIQMWTNELGCDIGENASVCFFPSDVRCCIRHPRVHGKIKLAVFPVGTDAAEAYTITAEHCEWQMDESDFGVPNTYEYFRTGVSV